MKSPGEIHEELAEENGLACLGDIIVALESFPQPHGDDEYRAWGVDQEGNRYCVTWAAVNDDGSCLGMMESFGLQNIGMENLPKSWDTPKEIVLVKSVN